MLHNFKKALLAGLALSIPAGLAQAEISNGTVKIGVLTDMSGPYSDTNGMGSVVATQMAVEKFGGSVNGKKIEVIFADHNNKTDVAASIVRRWFDAEGVDVIVDLTNSAVALAVTQIAKERDKAAIATAPALLELTNEACAPTTVHWSIDLYMLTTPLGAEMVASGAKNWYMFHIDAGVGRGAKTLMEKSLVAAGGSMVGATPHATGLQDFSTILLQSQRPDVEGRVFFTAGNDLIAAIRQANQFGLTSKQRIAAVMSFENELRGIGPAAAEGMIFVNHWYWNRNDNTRAFSKSWAEKMKSDRVPGYGQAGAYSSVLHYLKAVKSIDSDKGTEVVDEMKKTAIDDALFGKGTIRPDGRAAFPAYVWKAKGPTESKGVWDVASQLREIPTESAWQPLSESRCELITKKKQ